MQSKWTLILLLLLTIMLSSAQSTMALRDPGKKPPQDHTATGKDSIEWVEMWDEPITREEKLERMVTIELQRRSLYALQEKKYVKPGKDHLYRIDPFQVMDMRTVKGGFSEMDVLVSVRRVLNNEIEKKAEKYLLTFRHHYDTGFVVTGCEKIAEKGP